jgi:hypothetical protein
MICNVLCEMVSRSQNTLATTRGAMLALFLLALLNRFALVAVVPFDGLYGQDAYAYYEYARELSGALARAQFPPPFWWSLGYPLVLNAGFLLGGIHVGAAQMITLLCGALVAPFAFALAVEAAPAQKIVAGWVAGLLCVVGGQFAQSSIVIMADAPALMFATLGAWLLLRYASGESNSPQPTRETSLRTFGVAPHVGKSAVNTVHEQPTRETSLRTLCLASFAVGLAVWMRWQNLIFAAAWFAALAAVEWRAARFSKSSASRFCLAVGIVALVLAPQLWLRATTNAPLAGQSWLEGWSPANFFAQTFDNVDGHFEYALPVALFYAQVAAHPAYLFVMLTPFLAIGSIALLKRMNSLLQVNILLLGWILGMYIFLAGIPYENFRFPLGFFTPLAVVTGVGAGWAWARRNSGRAQGLLAAWIFIALLVMLAWQPRVLAPVWESKAQQLAHARWLETKLLPNALLYTMSIDGAVREYTNVRVENLWDMDPAQRNPETPTYLYADTNNIETQWRGKLPDQLVRALTETNNLHPLDSFRGWTLFRVRDCKYRVLDCE